MFWLAWLVPIGGGVLFLIVKLLIDRLVARQVARMKLLEATSVDPKPQGAPVRAPVQTKTDAPYRSAAVAPIAPVQADPEEELARLAAEGERRVLEANVARDNRIEWVRLERLCDAMQLLPETNGPATVPTPAEFPAPGELVYGQEDSTSAPPEPLLVASAARKAVAEQAWLASLPFPVTHYFAVLAEPPKAIFRLEITVELSHASKTPDLNILRGVVHVHDVTADVVLRDDGVFDILVDKDTVSLAGYFPYTVRKIAPYVHGLVEKALMPLHRGHPIARVSLART
jgi:hypothetical protein